MRCYASKQAIAQICFFAFMVLFLITFAPYEGKFNRENAVKEQEIQKTSKIKSPSARSGNRLEDTIKQKKPDVQIVKGKSVDGQQKLDNEGAKPIKGKLEQIKQNTKPIAVPDKVNKEIPAKEITKPEQIKQKTKLDETKQNSDPNKVNKMKPSQEQNNEIKVGRLPSENAVVKTMIAENISDSKTLSKKTETLEQPKKKITINEVQNKAQTKIMDTAMTNPENIKTSVNKDRQTISNSSDPDDKQKVQASRMHVLRKPLEDVTTDTREKEQTKRLSVIANVKPELPLSELNHVQPVIIPNVNELQRMNRDQLQELYFLYMENLQTHCVRQRHIGNEETGGYHICEDVMNRQHCLLYSFGCRVDNDWSFDVGVSERYGCDVHSFNKTHPQLSKNPTTKLTYHPLQLGGRDDPERSVLTLASIKSKLGHIQKRITILKLDIDADEWEFLSQITKGKELQNVKLLIVEFHLCTDNCVKASSMSKDKFVQYLNVLKSLYDIGFRTYYFRMRPSCSFSSNGVSHTACHDVHMMNK